VKRFADLSEQEVLALAISNEDEDNRICRSLGLPPRLRAGPPDLRFQPSTFLAGVLSRQSTYG
jgi:hypothetical protein